MTIFETLILRAVRILLLHLSKRYIESDTISDLIKDIKYEVNQFGG